MRPFPALRPRAAVLACSLGLLGLAAGCLEEQRNLGVDPPADQIFFPTGLSLDPTIDHGIQGACTMDTECGSADEGWSCVNQTCRQASRWLLVSNGNSDLRFNAGALIAFDLREFFAALEDEGDIRGPSESVTQDRPCRRQPGKPQVVECTEEPFAVPSATAHVGDFGTVLRAWDQDPSDDEALVLLPVRGDPSITYFSVRSDPAAGVLEVDCNQGADGGNDPLECADAFRLRHERNDTSLGRLPQEPFNVHISPDPRFPLAYVTHSTQSALTLINLEGLLVGGDGRPAIVATSGIFGISGFIPGGYGLAQRPCDPDDAPQASYECITDDQGSLECEACARPVVYGGFRWATFINQFTAISLDPGAVSAEGIDQECVGPDDLDQPGALVCEGQVDLVSRFSPGGLGVGQSLGGARLGDIAFSEDGNELYVVQTNPGGLLRVDTSVGIDGDTIDLANGAEEVCPQPSALRLYEDGGDRFGIVSCYRVGLIFIVDLESFDAIGAVRVGTGPHELAIDLAREVVYVANFLDASVSVVDMSRSSPTRFSEIARLGIQDPFSS